MIGRFIGMFLCLVGIFLLSLIVVTMMMFLTLDEDEYKAYSDIEINNTKILKNNYFNKYFDTFIKYKINKIRKAKYKQYQLQDNFILRNKVNILREQYLLRIHSSLFKPIKISDFCNATREMWESYHWKILNDVINHVDKLTPQINHFADNTLKYLKEFRNCKTNIFKILNVSRFISTCGNCVELKDINDIKGDSIVNKKTFRNYLKEFYITFRDNKMDYVPSADKTKSSMNSEMDLDDNEESEEDIDEGAEYSNNYSQNEEEGIN
jgi:hypothetical protein